MGKMKKGEMDDYQLALISKSVFDIGPRTRTIMLMFGILGVTLALIRSLVSHRDVPLDKIIHFSGYFILSATFVLALRPRYFIPGLLAVIGLGVVIEFLQRLTGRSFDPRDMIANTVGIACGSTAGLVARGIYAFISREVAARKAHQRLHNFAKGDTLIREGDPIEDMFIIKQGRVRALRNINGRDTEIATLGAGEVLGILGVVEHKPQYATLRALEPTVVYRMSMGELMESAGGDELPVSLVLSGLSSKVRALADQLSQSGRSFNADSTIA
ncbi:hypothetical protein PDESU_06252 [Pontiella desulfatans]|uniref:Cyclic nucleotide-binding domain-containing protein n=2 Tax=Pontiella desulfatans TaxID=2750659 RepID=A0A6C2UE02_PONDE|nr:hypothetical protein PDESU_06252 [Pontiella desulfatans]